MTKKARVRVKPAKGSSAREQAGHGQCLYVSLSSEAVTREMLDGPLAIDALQMTIAFPHVKRSHMIAARRDSRINLYAWPLLASKILRAIGLAGQGERRKDQDDFPSGIVFKNFCQVARRRRSS